MWDEQVLAPLYQRTGYPVPAQVSGYIQGVDGMKRLDLARNHRTIVRGWIVASARSRSRERRWHRSP